MSPVDRKTPAVWLQWLILALAACVAFGAVIPDFYMAADDLFATGMMDEVDRGGSASFFEKIYSVLFQAGGGGHFRPVQDLLYVILYEIFGADRWIRAVAIVYALCHLASAGLVLAIMARLGCSPRLAFAAALAFVLHPTFDENLASVQFGNNVPGLTVMLGACLLWLPAGSDARRRWRLAGAAVLIYAAIGLGINFMVSAAVLFSVMAVAIAASRRSMRDLVERGVALAAALGLGVLHRQLAYGAVGTRHGDYPLIRPTLDLPLFFREAVDAAVLLRVSPTTIWAATMNPPGIAFDDGKVPLVSADSIIVVVAAAGLVALAFAATRPRDEFPVAARGGGRLAPSFWFGLLLSVSMLLPYFAFVGTAGVHRYISPAIAGLAISCAAIAGGAGRVAARILPAHVVAGLGAVVLALVLAAFLRVDRESARSIAAGHRVTRAIVSQVSEDVAANPAIDRVFLLGQPGVIGRAGYTTISPHLRRVLNAKLHTRMNVHEQDYFESLAAGALALPLGPEVGLYVLDPDGATVRRIPRGDEDRLPAYVLTRNQDLLLRAYGLRVLTGLGSTDATTVQSALRFLLEVPPGLRSALILTAFESSASPSEDLLQAVLDVARQEGPNGRGLAAAVAVRALASPSVERAAFDLLARDNPAFEPAKARSASAAETNARAAAGDVATTASALESFRAALKDWEGVGVARPDLRHSIALCERSAPNGPPEGIAIRRLASDAETAHLNGRSIAVRVILESSAAEVPGGVSPISGRLRWEWVRPDGTTEVAGEQWMAQDGLAHGEKRVMTWIMPLPAPSTVKGVRVTLFVHGKQAASLDLRPGG